ncbi:hypothetical protein Btru_044223 [Bulinus truncatus]|nr:hypothetical protein Btru_044223 [Bulinus truncatus]
MHRLVGHSSILAVGGGTFLYCFHKKKKFFNTVTAETTVHCKPEDTEGYANVPVLPGEEISDEPITLTLCHVQVIFRHGARVPLNLIPKVEEASFDTEFMSREHQACVFPYQKVSCVTGKPIGWSNYEMKLENRILKGGVCCGTLTSYGKDQVYQLGRTLRACYRDRLGLCSYNPNDVIAKSSNIKRTVESAACVLAGLFGKTELEQFAAENEPVKIFIPNDRYNILVPDTTNCEVLRSVNHSAMLHPDFIPGVKEDKQKLEDYLTQTRQKQLECVEKAQEKINKYLEFQGVPQTVNEYNDFRNLCERDLVLDPLLEERNAAILKVNRFWYSVMLRHPVLCEFFSEDDYLVLSFLRGLEIDEFTGTNTSGYRVHFYFEANPFFHNKHLCKEVYTSGTGVTSKSTPIVWKDNYSQRICARSQAKDQLPCFLKWYTQTLTSRKDNISKAFFDIALNPVIYLDRQPKYRDQADLPVHFVFCRDDLVSRITHGWLSPVGTGRLKTMIDENATKLMHSAMTGQHEKERCVVTRLSAGPLLTEMVNTAEGYIKGKCQLKLCLYSSHDSTLTALLEALGLWEGQWPPFAADIRLELYKEVDRDQWYVRVLYLGKVRKIRGQTEDYVHWQAFKKAISKYMITADEHGKLCASDILQKIAKDILRHEAQEVETKESLERSSTPAGM